MIRITLMRPIAVRLRINAFNPVNIFNLTQLPMDLTSNIGRLYRLSSFMVKKFGNGAMEYGRGGESLALGSIEVALG